jgi:hypothetical protein
MSTADIVGALTEQSYILIYGIYLIVFALGFIGGNQR